MQQKPKKIKAKKIIILSEKNSDDGWDRLMEIRKKLAKGKTNKKNSVEILSEMRR